MENITTEQMLEAGVHFGHLRKKWNPKMLPYIFMEKRGIHIIDLNKTKEELERTAAALKQVAKSGKKVLYVGTKKQAKDIIENAAKSVNMPFVTERWQGGMLTNFATIRRSVKKMQNIERMLNDGTLENVTKKEKMVMNREREKMEKVIGGIASLNRLPSALLLVDIKHEHLALSEAHRLGINTYAMCDTNSDPTSVDFAVPSNDDSSKSIALVVNYLTEAIKEGLAERKNEKAAGDEE
jgi:small subunit ribosomal protein S2